MKTHRRTDQGFTLIELLVVITIIAILATVATPMIGKARVSARMIPATKNVQSILTAMTLYSGDYGGLYPEGEGNANHALRKLFPDALEEEKLFYIRGDVTFCDPASPPDEKIGEANGEPNGQALEAGENHWAYVSGLSDSNKSSTPVLADGFTEGIGVYGPRHVWSGPGKAILGFLDGSASQVKLRDGEPINSNGDNYFETPDIADDEYVQVLNPLPRRRSGGA